MIDELHLLRKKVAVNEHLTLTQRLLLRQPTLGQA